MSSQYAVHLKLTPRCVSVIPQKNKPKNKKKGGKEGRKEEERKKSILLWEKHKGDVVSNWEALEITKMKKAQFLHFNFGRQSIRSSRWDRGR